MTAAIKAAVGDDVDAAVMTVACSAGSFVLSYTVTIAAGTSVAATAAALASLSSALATEEAVMATLQSRGVVDAPALEAVAAPAIVTLPPSPPPAASPPPPTRTPTDDDADADDDDTVPLFEIGDTPPLPLGAVLGGTLGGAAAVFVCGALLIVCLRRRNATKQPLAMVVGVAGLGPVDLAAPLACVDPLLHDNPSSRLSLLGVATATRKHDIVLIAPDEARESQRPPAPPPPPGAPPPDDEPAAAATAAADDDDDDSRLPRTRSGGESERGHLRSRRDIEEPAAKVVIALEELISTEEEHVAALRALAVHYPKALASSLSPEEINAIFGGTATILGINELLLSQLKAAAPTDALATRLAAVAAAFDAVGPALKGHAGFCANYFGALATLTTLRSDRPAVEAAVRKAEDKAARTASEFSEVSGFRDMRLAAVLIAPVQRLMRYPMLLEALLSAIAKAEAKAEGHIAAIEFAAPRQRLTAAAERVAATAQQVNAMVTDAQNRCCVAEVHERVRGAAPGLIAPHRRLLLDAEIGGRKLEKKKGAAVAEEARAHWDRRRAAEDAARRRHDAARRPILPPRRPPQARSADGAPALALFGPPARRQARALPLQRTRLLRHCHRRAARRPARRVGRRCKRIVPPWQGRRR